MIAQHDRFEVGNIHRIDLSLFCSPKIYQSYHEILQNLLFLIPQIKSSNVYRSYPQVFPTSYQIIPCRGQQTSAKLNTLWPGFISFYIMLKMCSNKVTNILRHILCLFLSRFFPLFTSFSLSIGLSHCVPLSFPFCINLNKIFQKILRYR